MTNPLISPQNHLFELARLGRRLPHILLAVVLTFVFVIVAQLAGGALMLPIILARIALNPELSFDDPEVILQMILPQTAVQQATLLILSFGPIFLVLWAWLALFEKRPYWTLGLERRGVLFKYLRGFGIGLAMFVASIAISALLGYITFEESSPPQPQGVAALGGVLIVLLGWLVQGAAEELLARGWLMPVIGARYRPLWGILISSLVFAVLHSLNPNLNPIAMLNLFLFGLFTALYALYEGSLWGVFSIHTVWNWAQGNLFGFEVSGQASPGGTLFDLMETGPDLVTGGPFGPEGGLAVTVVLLAACGLVWWLGSRQSASETA